MEKAPSPLVKGLLIMDCLGQEVGVRGRSVTALKFIDMGKGLGFVSGEKESESNPLWSQEWARMKSGLLGALVDVA